MERAYYAIIPADVRYDKDLPSNAKLLYGEITALCNERGYCWASNEYFAGLYEVSPRSITRWIGALEDKRYIRVELIRKGENIVERRRITIGDKNVYVDKNVQSDRQNCLDDVDKNVQYNNTFNNTNISCPSDAEQQSFDFPKTDLEENLAEDFEKIWEIYPRKDGKNTAFNHYKAWLKGKKYAGKTVKLTNRQMWFAVDKYAKEIELEKKEKRFIKMGSTFFNEAIMEYVQPEE